MFSNEQLAKWYREAADLIRETDKITAVFMERKNGRACYCTMGAVLKVAGYLDNDGNPLEGFDTRSDAFHELMAPIADLLVTSKRTKTRDSRPFWTITAWNDSSRDGEKDLVTKWDVYQVLNEAADYILK